MTQPWQPCASLAALDARARILRQIREFFWQRGVLEVQTPVLAAHTVTEVQIDSIGVPGYGFLQTSPEYHMKRLLAAGAPSMYQIVPVFRAGEQGRLHNPEFTMLEWYRLGYDDVALRAEVAALVDVILGAAPVVERTYAQLLDSHAEHSSTQDQTSDAELDDDYLLVQRLRALAAEGSGRVFVTDYPAQQAALARLRSDPLSNDNESVAARFEYVVDGVEIANGYHELGDATELRKRFEADLARRAELGRDAVALDEPMLAAHEQGLPDCAGVALGVDRLVMLALGADSLAEVVSFTTDRA